MTKSESQNKKGKGGRKPKFDYASEEFLSLVESYAKKGFTDGEIAHAIGIEPETFCRKKKEFTRALCNKLSCPGKVPCHGSWWYQNEEYYYSKAAG